MAEFAEDDPNVAVRVLAERVANLGREKEALERDLEKEREDRLALDKRVAAMERAFQRGYGIALALPVIGGAVGVLMAYGRTIFAPWIGK
jgi:hypothetical protein